MHKLPERMKPRLRKRLKEIKLTKLSTMRPET